jgi:hypothetical protein
MIMNLRNSADTESNNADTCDQSKWDEWSVGNGRRFPGSELTNEQDPAVSHLTYKTAVSEALDEQGERKTTPSTDEVPGQLPKEYSDRPTSTTGYSTRQDEEAFERRARRVHLVQHAKLEDEHEAYQRKGIETDQEERSPATQE